MKPPFQIHWGVLGLFLISAGAIDGPAADLPRNTAATIAHGSLPTRVHVFEDYETEIEKRWWLRGAPQTNGNLPPSRSTSVPNLRVCRAAPTKDFDDKRGDSNRNYRAVIFNPVPGPPMGANTRLGFRYWLDRTDTLRVQIYSLSKGYHRHLILTNLPQRSWQSVAVDMTRARRPDSSGGALAADERIDDIQFYVPPEADLLIDDIVLYEAAGVDEAKPFPQRIIFTGGFDTGAQGAGREWPGDFEIVRHEAPLTWKAAKSVVNPSSGRPWIRIHLRGERPLSNTTRLRFRYRLEGGTRMEINLSHAASRQAWKVMPKDLSIGRWTEATVDFAPVIGDALADEIQFLLDAGAELQVDDVLLFEP